MRLIVQREPENEGRAAHQPQKVRTENLKLRTAMQGLYMTMMTFRLSNVSISFPTIHTHTHRYRAGGKLPAANFGCKLLRIMPEIVFKLLRTAIWSG